MLETSRSGYYDWLKNSAARKERKKQREKLVEAIRRIHEESGGTYGSPRILRVLRSEGIKCGKHRLEKLMREEGIFGKQKRKWVATTDSNHGNPILPNRLNRNKVDPVVKTKNHCIFNSSEKEFRLFNGNLSGFSTGVDIPGCPVVQ